MIQILGKTKSYGLYGLVFFILVMACRHRLGPGQITVIWKEDKAIGLNIPIDTWSESYISENNKSIQVHLVDHPAMILGEFKSAPTGLTFYPLIPFTQGLVYQVVFQSKPISQIRIPESNTVAPVVNTIYPIQDTLPANLLKFYIRFSSPMQAGEVIQYIRLIKNETDTLSEVFMDLSNELWNADRTQLTLWLNPGRIKRGLQPHDQLGPPLEPQNHYQLLILGEWRDMHGKKLNQIHEKSFYTSGRDTLSPDLDHMVCIVLNSQEIEVLFPEPLDHELLYHTFAVVDAQDDNLVEHAEPNEEGTSLRLKIKAPNLTKRYRLKLESRLEDLAGNNMNRLFDKEYRNDTMSAQTVYYKRIDF